VRKKQGMLPAETLFVPRECLNYSKPSGYFAMPLVTPRRFWVRNRRKMG